MDKTLKDAWIDAVKVKETYTISNPVPEMNRCRYCHVICADDYCSPECHDEHVQEVAQQGIYDAIDEMYAANETASVSDGPSYQAWLDAQNNASQNQHNSPEYDNDIPW